MTETQNLDKKVEAIEKSNKSLRIILSLSLISLSICLIAVSLTNTQKSSSNDNSGDHMFDMHPTYSYSNLIRVGGSGSWTRGFLSTSGAVIKWEMVDDEYLEDYKTCISYEGGDTSIGPYKMEIETTDNQTFHAEGDSFPLADSEVLVFDQESLASSCSKVKLMHESSDSIFRSQTGLRHVKIIINDKYVFAWSPQPHSLER